MDDFNVEVKILKSNGKGKYRFELVVNDKRTLGSLIRAGGHVDDGDGVCSFDAETDEAVDELLLALFKALKF